MTSGVLCDSCACGVGTYHLREPIMQTLLIRPATDDDLPALLSLLSQPDMDGDQVISLTEAQAIFRRVAPDANHQIYVASADRELVGTFTLLIVNHLSHRGARSLIVEDVVVKTNW